MNSGPHDQRPERVVDDPRARSHTGAVRSDSGMFGLLEVLARRWLLSVAVPLGITVSTGILLLFVPNTYTAHTSVAPEESSRASLPTGLVGLASQFGVSLGTGATQSPDFYRDVILSRTMLQRVLLTQFAYGDHQMTLRDSVRLFDIISDQEPTYQDSLEKGIRKFRKRVRVEIDRRSNMIKLEVDASDPVLAADLANAFVTYLNQFNATMRRSNAGEQRAFIETVLEHSQHDLRLAEDRLRRFYEQNRQWTSAPSLAFEEGRLRRQVEMFQQVYTTLQQQAQAARIEEVNDTPVLTVIDRAIPPRRKSKPKRSLWTLFVMLAAFAGGVLAATVKDGWDRARREANPAYERMMAQFTKVRHVIRGSARRSAQE